MIFITMQYFGNNGASSQKGSGGGRASAGRAGAEAKTENTIAKTTSDAPKTKQPEAIKELSLNLDFGASESSKSIQSKLEKAKENTWIEINNSLSYRKNSKGTWDRVSTKTGAIMGTAKATNLALAKTIYNKKHGY